MKSITNNMTGNSRLIAKFKPRFLLPLLFLLAMPSINSVAAQQKNSQLKQKTNVYILDSEHNRRRIKQLKLDTKAYTLSMSRFAAYFEDTPHQVIRIDGEQIIKLPSDSILLVIDALALSEQNIVDINIFVEDGGSLLFNHKAGFYDAQGNLRGDQMVRQLTGLNYNAEDSEQLDFDGHFMTPKILSPLTQYLPEAKRLTLIAFESLALFENTADLEPDMILSDWSRTETPRKLDNTQIGLNQAGVLWHGLKGKGRWVYFSLPGHVFNVREYEAKEFEKLLHGIIDYLSLAGQIRIMPYLDLPSASVVFEDVEHQYETLNDFIDLSLKYNIPMTTYQVAEKAESKPEILKRSRLLPQIEVSSHSYTHGAIVGRSREVLAKEVIGSRQYLQNELSPIKGYRPPREEIDADMLNVIREAGYGYVFAGIQDKLYPEMLEDGFITIPRLGSDDYEFFILKKLSPAGILFTSLKEEELARALNGVYTLGVHTQLMTQPEHIHILDGILSKLVLNPQTKFITAEDMVERVRLTRRITTRLTTEGNNHRIKLTNNNQVPIRHLVLRFYWQGSQPIKQLTSQQAGVELRAVHYYAEKYSDIHVWNIKAKNNLDIIIQHE